MPLLIYIFTFSGDSGNWPMLILHFLKEAKNGYSFVLYIFFVTFYRIFLGHQEVTTDLPM